MKHFTLNPNETMHIRISCAADTSARLLHSILDKLDDCAGAKLIGHLLFEASPVSHVAELENTTISDSFAIAGVLVPGTTFGLSTLSLDFSVAKGDESGFPSHPSTWVCEDIQSSFTILNPSPVSSLNFAITATPCRHAGLRFRLKDTDASSRTAHSGEIVTDTLLPVTDITQGTISPGDSQVIAVRLAPGTFAPQRNKAYAAFASQEAVDSVQNEVSRTMQVSVHDSDMPLKTAQTILVHLSGFDDSRGGGSQNERVERFENLPSAVDAPTTTKSSEKVWPTKSRTSSITLRGCTLSSTTVVPVRATRLILGKSKNTRAMWNGKFI